MNNASNPLPGLPYKFSYISKPFGFAVTRVVDGIEQLVFNSSVPDGSNAFSSMIYTDQVRKNINIQSEIK